MISISKCSWPFGGKHDFWIFDNSLFLFQIQIYCTCILIFNNDIFNNLNMAYYLSKFFISVNLNARTLSVSKMSGNILIINIRMSLSVYPKHWRVCWYKWTFTKNTVGTCTYCLYVECNTRAHSKWINSWFHPTILLLRSQQHFYINDMC